MWMHDPTVRLHLVTELDTGVVHLFIGDQDRKKSMLYITFSDDPEEPRPHVDGAILEHAKNPTVLQLKIIASVLRTMNYADLPIIGHLWAAARRRELEERP